MKILLDENLPHDLRHLLVGHEVFTAAYMGWRGVQNGSLLAKAAQENFYAVVSLDSGIEFQQNLVELPCAVVILEAESNRLRHLRPLVPALLAELKTLRPRTVVQVRAV